MMSAAEDKIRERAYALWLADGMCHGGAERNWLHAEQEIVEEAHVAPKPVLVKPAKPARVGSSGRPDANSGAAKPSIAKPSIAEPSTAKPSTAKAVKPGVSPTKETKAKATKTVSSGAKSAAQPPLQDRCLQSRHPQARCRPASDSGRQPFQISSSFTHESGGM